METPVMEMPTTTAVKHKPWRPYSENPDHDIATEAVDAPKNPIGVPELIDPSKPLDAAMGTSEFEPVASGESNPDLHIVMRALQQAGLGDQLIHATQEALELPFYRELVNYRIEFVHEGRHRTLNRVSETLATLPPATAQTEPSSPRQRRAEHLYVVIELRDPITMRGEERRLPVDIAFLNTPEIYWPKPYTIMLSTAGSDPTVTDLAELITDACFSESDARDDDSVVTQLERHRDHAYKTAASLLLPRHLALAAVVERHIQRTFENFLEDGEGLKINVIRRHRGRIDTSVTTAVPPPEADATEN